MILVDSSVWIDHINQVPTAKVLRLRELLPDEPVLIGDLILCEILRGFRSDAQAMLVERSFRRFEHVALCSPALAAKAADNYRLLRSRGITVQKTIDLLIGTFCIERGHALLHSDRDFEPMERYLGLRTA